MFKECVFSRILNIIYKLYLKWWKW